MSRLTQVLSLVLLLWCVVAKAEPPSAEVPAAPAAMGEPASDAEMEKGWQALIQRQSELEAAYRDLTGRLGTAESIVERLNAVATLPTTSAEEKQKVRAQAVAWGQAFDGFHGQMDAFTSDVYEQFIKDYSPARLRAFVENNKAELTEAEMTATLANIATLEEKLKAVEAARRPLEGRVTDRERLESVNAYMRQVADTFKSLEGPQRPGRIKKFFGFVSQKRRFVEDVAVMLLHQPGLWAAKKSGEGTLSALKPGSAVEYWLKGYTTNLIGEQNVVEPGVPVAENKEAGVKPTMDLNVFVPEHASFKDGWIVNALADKNVRLLAATNLLGFMEFIGVPKPVIEQFRNSKNILWTGEGIRNPLAPLIEDIKAGKQISSLIIFGEGTLPTDLAYERRPLNEGFARNLIPILMRAGARIHLYPTSMPNNHRLAGTDRDDIVPKSVQREHPELSFDTRDLNGIIHKPITPQALELMYEGASKEERGLLGTIVRQSYYEGADQIYGTERFVGAPRLDQLRQMVQLRMEQLCKHSYRDMRAREQERQLGKPAFQATAGGR